MMGSVLDGDLGPMRRQDGVPSLSLLAGLVRAGLMQIEDREMHTFAIQAGKSGVKRTVEVESVEIRSRQRTLDRDDGRNWLQLRQQSVLDMWRW